MTLRTALQQLEGNEYVLHFYGTKYRTIGFNLLKDFQQIAEDLSNEVFSFDEADYILFSFESPNTDEVLYLNQLVYLKNNLLEAETIDGDVCTVTKD